MSTLPPFPVDDATLDLVWGALHPGPEAERSSLFDMLDLYSRLGGSDPDATVENDDLPDDIVELRDPQYSPHDLIAALITEIRRLRSFAELPPLMTPERMRFIARAILVPNPKDGDVSEAASLLARAADALERKE